MGWGQEYVGISIQGNLATVGAFTLEQYMLRLYADYSQSDIDDSGFFHQYAPLSAKGKETAGGAGAEGNEVRRCFIGVKGISGKISHEPERLSISGQCAKRDHQIWKTGSIILL